MPKENRALVRGVNMVGAAPEADGGGAGRLVRKEAPIHLSNIAIADPTTGKPTRVGFKTLRGRPQGARRQALGRDYRWLRQRQQ